MRTVVLVSGRGSNLAAIFEAQARGECAVEIAAVISDRASAPALKYAEERGIATAVIAPKGFTDRKAWDSGLARAVAGFDPSLVVLAGFMRILGAPMIELFAGRIVNVHPALLPSFPGKDGPAQAVAAGVRISGCTVHLVDSGVDTGPILAQAAVPVLPDDDTASLHARIQLAEHRLFPRIVGAIASGKIRIGDEPGIEGALAETPDALHWPRLR